MNIFLSIPKGNVRDTFVTPRVIDALSKVGALIINEGEHYPSVDAWREYLQKCDVCVTGWGAPTFDERILPENTRLKLLAHTGGSVANLTGAYFFDHGLRVISGNRYYAISVAEGTLAYMLSALRDIPFYHNRIATSGVWHAENDYSRGLFGRSVGLIGFGAVARYLVPMLRPFEVDIYAYDPFVNDALFAELGVKRMTDMRELSQKCDIVSLHLPKTPETYHVVNGEILAAMPDGGILINTARGATLDTAALVDELKIGRLFAVLDVFEQEPLPNDHPLIGLRNAILMPHMAGPTLDRREFVGLRLADDIARFAKNQPLIDEIPREYALMMTRE